jgi:hypothetical protein
MEEGSLTPSDPKGLLICIAAHRKEISGQQNVMVIYPVDISSF